jgi:hypothetical protein
VLFVDDIVAYVTIEIIYIYIYIYIYNIYIYHLKFLITRILYFESFSNPLIHLKSRSL